MATCLLVSTTYAASHHLDDFAILAQILLNVNTSWHTIYNFIFYQLNHYHIQNVTDKMEKFCNVIKAHEEVVIQRYIDKCAVFYGASMFTFYLVTFAIITLVPPMTHRPFPTLAEYPFNVSYQPLKTIIYIHQSMVGIMMAAQLSTNVFISLLLWFASARFEILSEELKKATDFYSLFQSIKKHQELF
ncbi:PREDICTED: uncharacterized protein LOC105461732, partial [Wasmannia auropunctata]|uniref:uncharacterized protein LOC105461732 n=1 Tax=Wasmannia auropunctata TaxID=64793 RepID=UPI0005EF5DB4